MYIILAVILLVIVVYYFIKQTRPYRSTIDNTEYNVVYDTENMMKETSNALSIIHNRVTTLINYLLLNNTSDISKKTLDTLQTKYARGIISEAVIESGSTSYTIDKANIHVCLRSRDSEKQIYDINTLMYVVLHELSHLVSPSIGHNQEFKTIFKFLASTAIKAGVYVYVDYSKTNINYCGLLLTTNILN